MFVLAAGGGELKIKAGRCANEVEKDGVPARLPLGGSRNKRALIGPDVS